MNSVEKEVHDLKQRVAALEKRVGNPDARVRTFGAALPDPTPEEPALEEPPTAATGSEDH